MAPRSPFDCCFFLHVSDVSLRFKEEDVYGMGFFDSDSFLEIVVGIQPLVEEVPLHLVDRLDLDGFSIESDEVCLEGFIGFLDYGL